MTIEFIREGKPFKLPEVPMYVYGMRLRGFSPGCQPIDGLDAVMEGNKKYYNILIYNRELTDEEIRDYELDRLEYEDWKDRNDKG